jgi:type I restriction enzyme M protein
MLRGRKPNNAKSPISKTEPQTAKADTGANLGFEAKLWQAADALRSNMDAAEYKHIVLGLIFLKYISDAFEAKYEELVGQKKQGADPEDPDEYVAERIFWVPKEARWSYLKTKAPQPEIGKLVDDAMDAIERKNPTLKGVLPKDYGRAGLDRQRLAQLINLVSDIALGAPADRAKDTLGRVYEYFLSQFASAEGKRGGQFYTPSRVVRVLVEMLAPYKGRVYDPCCGSGGMFVSSEKFIESHSGKIGDISVWGQESNHTTWRLAKMNLAIRGIDAQIARGDTFHNDQFPDLKADYVLANPPFNDSDWRGELLKDDKRWVYGLPPAGNANYAWVQHFIHHLAPTGTAGFVLANGSMSSNQSNEGEIRKNIIEADLVDCMVAMPGQLFYSTQIPVCLWFIARNKKGGQPSPSASLPPLPMGEGQGEGAGRLGEGGIKGTARPGEKETGNYRGNYEFSGLVDRARELRKKQTPTEEVMWEMLRDRRFLGLKFRRQHQIGDYIVDFYCDEKRVVVELDGGIHESRRDKDQKRDSYLQSSGFRVIRFKNEEFFDDMDGCLAHLADSLFPSPSGRGAGVRGTGFRDRTGEILFIDARKMGTLVDRVHRDLSDADVAKIAGAYHAWRSPSPSGRGEGGEGNRGAYKDIPGFCKAVKLEEIQRQGYVLTPGRYVGAEEVEDDGEPFAEKMARLTAQLMDQMKEGEKLDAEIKANLNKLGFLKTKG